jgi:hypothetical protein
MSMERLLPLLETSAQTTVHMFAESRGKKEDRQLREVFDRVRGNGTKYIGASRFTKVKFNLTFRGKDSNVVGMELADPCAYPIARHVIDASRQNRAFDVIKPNIYEGTGNVRGLKVFP